MKVVLVTGANRGIGLEVVRQLASQGMQVVLGARDPLKGEAAAQPLIQAGLSVFPHQLDVTDQDSIDRLRAEVAAQFGRLDILVNNAAILYDTWQQATTADLKVVHTGLETNLFGAWRMCQAYVPLLRGSGWTMSSSRPLASSSVSREQRVALSPQITRAFTSASRPDPSAATGRPASWNIWA